MDRNYKAQMESVRALRSPTQLTGLPENNFNIVIIYYPPKATSRIVNIVTLCPRLLVKQPRSLSLKIQ